jgi:hypothetical protein
MLRKQPFSMFPRFLLDVTFFDTKESNQRKLSEIVTHANEQPPHSPLISASESIATDCQECTWPKSKRTGEGCPRTAPTISEAAAQKIL